MREIVMLVLLLTFFTKTNGQTENKPSSESQKIANAIAYYDKAIGPEAAIFNGKDYVNYIFPRRGLAFLISEEMQDGWVSYKGKVYNNLRVQYDLYRYQLIVLNSDRIGRIVPESNYVDSFFLAGHIFIKLTATADNKLPQTSFYDRLYDGNMKFYVLRKKQIREIFEREYVIREFYNQDRYFVLKEGKYFPVSNKKDVMNLVGQNKKAISKELRSENLSFKKGFLENAVIRSLELNDELSN